MYKRLSVQIFLCLPKDYNLSNIQNSNKYYPVLIKIVIALKCEQIVELRIEAAKGLVR